MNKVKVVLLFTFAMPLLSILFYVIGYVIFMMTISFILKGTEGLESTVSGSGYVLLWMGSLAYIISIVPSFLIGLIASKLKFESKNKDYGLLLLASLIIGFVFFKLVIGNRLLLSYTLSLLIATAIIGYGTFLKRKN
jgi:hypothetical protein